MTDCNPELLKIIDNLIERLNNDKCIDLQPGEVSKDQSIAIDILEREGWVNPQRYHGNREPYHLKQSESFLIKYNKGTFSQQYQKNVFQEQNPKKTIINNIINHGNIAGSTIGQGDNIDQDIKESPIKVESSKPKKSFFVWVCDFIKKVILKIDCAK